MAYAHTGLPFALWSLVRSVMPCTGLAAQKTPPPETCYTHPRTTWSAKHTPVTPQRSCSPEGRPKPHQTCGPRTPAGEAEQTHREQAHTRVPGAGKAVTTPASLHQRRASDGCGTPSDLRIVPGGHVEPAVARVLRALGGVGARRGRDHPHLPTLLAVRGGRNGWGPQPARISPNLGNSLGKLSGVARLEDLHLPQRGRVHVQRVCWHLSRATAVIRS